MSELAIEEAINTVVSLPNAKLYKNGLEIEKNITIREWGNLVTAVKLINGSMMWWWGDLLNYGEQKHGEMYSQALDASDYTYSTLRNAKLICERIQLSRRRDKLTFEHHKEIAYSFKDQVDQDKWLDKADAETLTVIELRKAIRISKGDYTEDEIQPKEFNPLEATNTLVNWFKKQMKDKPISAWDMQRREALKEDLEPLVDIWNQL